MNLTTAEQPTAVLLERIDAIIDELQILRQTVQAMQLVGWGEGRTPTFPAHCRHVGVRSRSPQPTPSIPDPD